MEKTVVNLQEAVDRQIVSDKTLQKINEYYEVNLRAVSVRTLGDQVRHFEQMIDAKANTIEVKKLLSSIHECNDKFNYLEEVYKEERKSQEMINTNISLSQKNIIQKTSTNEHKIADLEKLTSQLSTDMKNKFAATSWMNSLAGGNNTSTELIRMNAEKDEENQKFNEKRFMEIASTIEKFKIEIQENVGIMKDALSSKVGLSTLEDQEERLQGLIDKLIINCNKRFQEKGEGKKQMALLEKQVKNIFDLILSKMDENEVHEAMMAKRPLGGWSCASCQKNINNLSG
mmetsp:Transcript_3174/g.3076  ORF Transcript_3174/g.3076 Transcript_3174/m.3076 type:complete len:287 (-) Transcript_3174:476-1336(-)|eukprot:CAMPEP_0170548820 /NCGR_PEP_ID=MMETSP0211-20121228/6998_1 /TAXON_ID=311385 /ORGANISM="Pseudokeronopsis sp., Strain OXSARD2" /LENGTH=286 /DNA_ID=CAMNT_0010854467 /DNA_START=1371 /DNA_END=2231 /DNA_ORIENTATION=+